MSNEELDIILKNIELRKPYVDKYYSIYKKFPQWLSDDKIDALEKEGVQLSILMNNEAPPFEEWMLAEIRDEKINKILNE